MDNNPYQAPETQLSVENSPGQYGHAGFWVRVGAHLLDWLLIFLVLLPIAILLGAMEVSFNIQGNTSIVALGIFIEYILPFTVIMAFWRYMSATPGKRALKLKIVDARTGGKPTTSRFVGRYLAYYLSAIPLGMGFIWVAIDKEKRGWHDMISGTRVVTTSPELRFEPSEARPSQTDTSPGDSNA